MIRCLAVDDEPLALDLLEDNIKRIPFLSLVKRCNDVYEAMEVMQTESIDLIFLDIQMPGITGTQFIKSMGGNKPMVILVTAYEKYAMEGFNLDVVDYLLKPVEFDRFLKACHKAQEYYQFKTSPTKEIAPDYLFVHSEYQLIKISLPDITHIEGLKDYIKIHLSSATRPVLTRMSMKAMEEKLPATRFLRVHKSFIVNLDKILSIRKSRIKLANAEVPVSDSYSEALMKIVDSKSVND
jgi:DNA-binding LytR/AlgR family response regulator